MAPIKAPMQVATTVLIAIGFVLDAATVDGSRSDPVVLLTEAEEVDVVKKSDVVEKARGGADTLPVPALESTTRLLAVFIPVLWAVMAVFARPVAEGALTGSPCLLP